MMNEDVLKFSVPKTQLETEQWIRNMENHLRINLVERKDEVPYALRYFEGSAATWWKMHQAIQGWNGAKTWGRIQDDSAKVSSYPESLR